MKWSCRTTSKGSKATWSTNNKSIFHRPLEKSRGRFCFVETLQVAQAFQPAPRSKIRFRVANQRKRFLGRVHSQQFLPQSGVAQ